MTNGDLINNFLEQGCLPHQAEFAAKFFDKESARIHLLLSPPGLGKLAAITNIIRHSIETGKTRRILLLTPSPLANQWDFLLKDAGLTLPVELLDRRRFRDLEFSKPSVESPLLETGIVIITTHLARQQDVAQAIESMKWDLLVVDEVHALNRRTQTGDLVENLLSQSEEVRGILLGLPNDQTTDLSVRFMDISETRWSLQDLRALNGDLLIPDVWIEWIAYRRSHEEIQFLGNLQEELRQLTFRDQAARFMALTILKAASSSLFALGQSLRRLRQRRNEVAHGLFRSDTPESLFGDIENTDSEQTDELSELPGIIELGDVVIPLIGVVEELPRDSKFEALQGLLDEITRPVTTENRICILTEFADTANFLASALRERFDDLSVLTGQRSFHDREKIIKRFREGGGIMIATRVVVASLLSSQTVIFYDVPLRPGDIKEQIALFVSANRFEPVRAIAFTDQSQALKIEGVMRTTPDGTDSIEETLFKSLF